MAPRREIYDPRHLLRGRGRQGGTATEIIVNQMEMPNPIGQPMGVLAIIALTLYLAIKEVIAPMVRAQGRSTQRAPVAPVAVSQCCIHGEVLAGLVAMVAAQREEQVKTNERFDRNFDKIFNRLDAFSGKPLHRESPSEDR